MICKKHGQLKEDEFYIQKYKTYEILRCRLCNREYAKASKKRRKDEVNEWYRNDRKLNPEKYKKYAQDFNEKYPGRKSKVEISRRRGITVNKYDEMLINQDNKCAICKKEESRKFKDGRLMKLTLDHDHKTEKVRQFLCHNCNTGIGKFFDSIDLLKAAIDYLKRHE